MSTNLDINALRAAFGTQTRQQAPSNYFPFFKQPDGEMSEVRFLPDANESNPLGFLVEKRSHVLSVNGRNKTVPCLKMYGKACPVCNVSSQYYNAGDSVNGKRYYRKLAHLAQVLVVSTPVQPEDGGEKFEGTVRLVQLSPQIHKVIHDSIMSGDLEELPYDYQAGTNFQIRKEKQGDYSTYNFSKFKKRESALDEETIDYVRSQLKDLATLLPAEPSVEDLEGFLEADLAGGEVSIAPRAPAATAEAVARQSAPAEAVTARQPAPSAETEDDDADMDAVLEAIRQRRSSQV